MLMEQHIESESEVWAPATTSLRACFSPEKRTTSSVAQLRQAVVRTNESKSLVRNLKSLINLGVFRAKDGGPFQHQVIE
jgi:hypothetical protein